MPPWPGIRRPESSAPTRLLKADSARSPICPMIEPSTPATASTARLGRSATQPASGISQPSRMLAPAAAATPPQAPAQVLAGLMRGARRGPPIVRPARYAPESLAQTTANSQKTVARPAASSPRNVSVATTRRSMMPAPASPAARTRSPPRSAPATTRAAAAAAPAAATVPITAKSAQTAARPAMPTAAATSTAGRPSSLRHSSQASTPAAPTAAMKTGPPR